jgi:UDP-3-O-[3-hydroxymyristoyl] N-acetylglucosamine deacetylase/3-hydroxyacyl-[acyl-carrier-protein] dehydratase
VVGGLTTGGGLRVIQIMTLPQQTLRETVTLEGVGLHGGDAVRMRLVPAAAGTGIRFRRVDLEGKPEVEAKVANVGETTRSTTLVWGNVRVHTVEHILAALAGCGVDNAVVELDAGEPPIGDGSARAYVRLIEKAGLLPQPEPREYYQPTSPIEVVLGDSTVVVFPHDRLKISCTSVDKRGYFTQFYSLEVTPESWARELAHARTFCFFEEIEQLIRGGLIRGGSLENAVIIRDDAVLTTEPLRYPEEFVRHKILDILGDLSLLGRPLRGHIMAVKPSHTLNCEVARQLDAQMMKPLMAAQTFAPPPARVKAGGVESVEATGLVSATSDPVVHATVEDVIRVMKTLPHRYPFLMVDRVTRMEGNRITGLKNVTINEPYFQGHFPGHPIMPGVLQLEAIAQVAGILTLQQVENLGKLAYFMSADNVKWRKPVRPGDTLIIDVELTKARGKVGRAKGRCLVDGQVVSEAEVTYMMG